MDLNDLFSRHQLALASADLPSCRDARVTRLALVDQLAERIGAFQRAVGAGFAGVRTPR